MDQISAAKRHASRILPRFEKASPQVAAGSIAVHEKRHVGAVIIRLAILNLFLRAYARGTDTDRARFVYTSLTDDILKPPSRQFLLDGPIVASLLLLKQLPLRCVT